MKMRCCVIPGGQTDAGSSQKHFLPFRVLLNIKIDPKFPQKRFFFPLFREKLYFPRAQQLWAEAAGKDWNDLPRSLVRDLVKLKRLKLKKMSFSSKKTLLATETSRVLALRL